MGILAAWKQKREKTFCEIFGAGGKLVWVSAPGRVNLIGEHTDYHEGFVLPAAISLAVKAIARPRKDKIVQLFSITFGDSYTFSLAEPMLEKAGWARRAEGIIRTVLEGAKDVRGMDILLDADLSVGGGLSSSAASMAAMGMLAADLNGIELDKISFARTLQNAEHRFAGLKCGIMDQLAVLLGKENYALLIDCRSIGIEYVAIPQKWAVVIMDTGVKHDLASSEYNKRQVECAKVLAEIKKQKPSVVSLRDVSHDDLFSIEKKCDPIGFKRCLHVLEENSRVLLAKEALVNGDEKKIDELFSASHISLRDQYEVSCKELDIMVEAAWKAPGIVGARMTGGGFGGSTVNLVKIEETGRFASFVSEEYKKLTRRTANVIITSCADGAMLGELT